jgi:hypothetical protein
MPKGRNKDKRSEQDKRPKGHRPRDVTKKKNPKTHAMVHRMVTNANMRVFIFEGRPPSWCPAGSKIAWVVDEKVDAQDSTLYADDGLYAVTKWDETNDPHVIMQDAVLWGRVEFSYEDGLQIFKANTEPEENTEPASFHRTSNDGDYEALQMRWNDLTDLPFWLAIDGDDLAAMLKRG